LAERTQREVHALCANHLSPIAHPPTGLRLLQLQHRAILGCIEAGQADAAVQRTRAHVNAVRDEMVAALMGTPMATLSSCQ
jgi:DNA-binding FadR family transcriptional regulator